MTAKETRVTGRKQDQTYIDELVKDPSQFSKIFTCLGVNVPRSNKSASSFFASHKDMATTRCIAEAWLEKKDPAFLKEAKEWENKMEGYADKEIPSSFIELPVVLEAMQAANNYPEIPSESEIKSNARTAFIVDVLDKHADAVRSSIWETYWETLTLHMRENYGDAYF